MTAIGPAAATALGDAADEVVDGNESGDLSVDGAARFFPTARTISIARDDVFADALAAGALLGRGVGGPAADRVQRPAGPGG